MTAQTVWLIAAAILIILGLVLFTVTMSVNHWDFTKLSTVTYETNTHEISHDFRNISIETDTADILFEPSDDGRCSVVCRETETTPHTVFVEEDTLVIRLDDKREWYEHIGINAGSPKITVYLPEVQYGALKIEEHTGDIDIPAALEFKSIDITASTGDVKSLAGVSKALAIHTNTGSIQAENASAEFVDLSVTTGHVNAKSIYCRDSFSVRVSTGKVKLSDVRCGRLYSTGDTGDLTMQNVVAEDSFSIERSTGDIKFDHCDAGEIIVKADTGDVTGSLLSEKIFMAQTDTGHVSVPRTTAGGVCEITTDTGDIKITVD